MNTKTTEELHFKKKNDLETFKTNCPIESANLKRSGLHKRRKKCSSVKSFTGQIETTTEV